MRYVIIRDDDTNALTPIECLERLYRPFLDRSLPINLATIPEVSTTATNGDGRPEGFLLKRHAGFAGIISHGDDGHPISGDENKKVAAQQPLTGVMASPGVDSGSNVPIAANPALVHYLLENPGYHIIQHGFHHEYLEFNRGTPYEIAAKLEHGTRSLEEAGFASPCTFVAPYDKLSRASLVEVAKRFQVISTGWFELRRLPYTWWPAYAFKKMQNRAHWRLGETILLSHPGCLLSYCRNYSTILDSIIQQISGHRLTVLVTHWWEYFRDGRPDEKFIEVLHETGNYLARNRDVKVIPFEALLSGQVPLN